MPEKLKYLVIHCTDTPSGREVSADQIRHWHTDPKPAGRGWKQVGYSDMIHLDGSIENLVPYDEDNLVDPEEITNGATGYNRLSHHIVYVGGCSSAMKPLDTRTLAQTDALLEEMRKWIARCADILICGHHDLNADKACPSFDVGEFCRYNHIPVKNIYKR